jgi:hypothetical protein
MEQNTISSMMERKQNVMKPNVARPCFANEQYAPQNPSAML